MQKSKLLLTLLMAVLILGGTAFGQIQQTQKKLKKGQSELVDTRIDNMSYWRQMAEKGLIQVAPVIPFTPAEYTGSEITALSVLFDDSPDVPVTDQTNVTQTENSSFIDPNNADYLLNSNNSTSWSGGSVGTLYGANYFQSDDAGLTWGGSVQGAGGGNSGDPAAAIGLDGRQFVGYISSSGGMGVAYSDNGVSWTQRTIYASGSQDKNHLWIDNSTSSSHEGNLYNVWTSFGGFGSNNILFSRSTNNGDTWSSAINISSAVNAGSHNQGCNVQSGPDGNVYVTWTIYDGWPSDESAIGFAKSTDGGVTFETSVRIIDNIRGIRTSETSKNHRVNSFPVMTVDISSGQNDGNIYITWSNIGVPGVNTGNDIDVYIIRSEDEGATWSNPIRVNQDPSGQGKEHYFPWIACDPETGTLSAIFYDDRNVSSSQCEVFCANSFDAGETWEDFKVSDVSFTPSAIPGLAGGYMGDYLSITARAAMVYPVWGDNRGGLYMTYVSPYVTNNLARPTDLVVDLDDENGETSLSWDFEEKDFLNFKIYRDGELLGTSTEASYTDNLPDYGVYDYLVTAMHDDGESTGAAASIQWGNPQISTSPDAVNENLAIGATSTKTLTIHNVGELQLDYNIGVEIISNKGVDSYCDASGGGDEFISAVEFGDINNTSSADGYADYTDQSTIVSMGDSYDITVTNGNVYTADDLGVWIDWNQDDDFEDAGENVVCEVSNSGQGIYSIAVPYTAVPGQTTMRIRIKWSDDDCGGPCGATSYGEVEDYSVYVLGWLIVDPTSGEIAAGESEDITLNFDAADLEEGVYTANLNISSNDPDAETIVIPVTLNVGEDIPEVIATADPNEICVGESSQLNTEAVGGSGSYSYSWTSNPEGFTSDIADPIVEPSATTTYSVAVFDGIYNVVETIEVVVNPLPEVSFVLESDSTCVNYPSYALEGGLPEGGEYSGEYVVGGEFSPVNAGAGVHVVTYTISDGNSCSNSAEAEIIVNPLPEVSFVLASDSTCVNYPNFVLEGGLPEGGEYSGEYVVDGEFNPVNAGVGLHVITYTYSDENGCTNSADAEVYVGECLGIGEFAASINVEVYPNPNKGVFALSLNTSGTEIVNISVMNNIGGEVYSLNNVSVNDSYKNEINLSEFADGLYYIHITSGDSYYLKKIVIRK